MQMNIHMHLRIYELSGHTIFCKVKKINDFQATNTDKC